MHNASLKPSTIKRHVLDLYSVLHRHHIPLDPNRMKLAAFKFDLPTKLIASHPLPERDDARLMVVHKDTGKFEHKYFKDLLHYFGEGDVLVTNDTKVFPALLIGKKEKTDADIEVLLLRELSREQGLWDVLVDPARKIRVGNKVYFGEGELVAEVLDNTTSRGRTLKFLFDGTPQELIETIDYCGVAPLPKELGRRATPEDKESYQTIYAKAAGSVVAPAAGLHFTPRILKRLELQGTHVLPLTLHIAPETIRPIEVEALKKHRSHSEFFAVSSSTAQGVNQALDHHKQVCAIGMSTAKALETSISVSGRLKPTEQWSNKFIAPPYSFKICTSLLTNFHLPASVPLVNSVAFGGYDLIMEAYQEAIKEKYRFFVYGDAMLII